MTREEKNQIIDDLAALFAEHKFIYVADSSAMTAAANNALRGALHKNGVSMQVVKNTLVRKALEKSGTEWGELTSTLSGTTALLIASNPKAPAVALKEFRKKNDRPLLKGAYIDSDVFIGDDQIEPLSTLKSKEDLIGDIIVLLQSPAKNVISGLQSGGSKLSGILKTLSERS
jgi:large subunit ribosomal protein L10